MPYLVAVVLGLFVGGFGRLTRFDRDRAFYPTALVVIAWYYILFAAMAGSRSALLGESVQLVVFTTIAVVGFRTNLWWVAIGIAGHGAFDAVHGYLVTNPGMPPWWPAFCGTIDVLLGAILGWLLYRRSISASPAAATASPVAGAGR